MSKPHPEPVLVALAPAIDYIENVFDKERELTAERVEAAENGAATSWEAIARAEPKTLSDVVAMLAAISTLAPWDHLASGFSHIDAAAEILDQAIPRMAAVLVQHGASVPASVLKFTMGIEPEPAANAESGDGVPTEELAVPKTPEIERVYARWAKARGDMLVAYVSDGDPDTDAKAGDALNRISAEAWAMVGQPAPDVRRARLKIEVFRDQFDPGGNRLDGLELALVNSLDTDLAVLTGVK